MGCCNATAYFEKTDNLLYYVKPFTNEMSVWSCEQGNTSEVAQLKTFVEGKTYEIGGLESISTSKGCIYFIGGVQYNMLEGAAKHLVDPNTIGNRQNKFLRAEINF